MTVSDPTSYQVVVDMPAEKYFELLQRANAAGFGTVQEYLLNLGEPKKLTPSAAVIHTVEEKGKGK